MTPRRPASERGLVWVVQSSSALSLGTLAALLYSVKQVVPTIRFELTWAAGIAFLLAAGCSLAFWHVIFKLSSGTSADPRPASTRLRLYLLAFLLGGGLIAGFLYPLKDFSSDKMTEIGVGSLMAILFLSGVAVLMWKVIRHLETDGPPPPPGPRT